MNRYYTLLLFLIFAIGCTNESADEQEEACDNGTFVGDVHLTTQEEVDDFGAMCYSRIEGDLWIRKESGLTSNIVSLENLNSLEVIEGALAIEFNNNLVELTGLENLSSIENLHVFYNESLNSLNPLGNIESHVDGLAIRGNDALTNLIGLEGLQMDIDEVTNDNVLSIIENSNLQTLNGLNEIVKLNEILILNNENLMDADVFSNLKYARILRIEDNPNLLSIGVLDDIEFIRTISLYRNQLSDLSAFKNVSTPLFLLIINELNSLTSLEYLSNLSSIENLEIVNNSSLLSLDGLNNLEYNEYMAIGGAIVTDQGNENLINFCALQNLFTNGSYVEDEVYIMDNTFNPTVEDIIAGNCSL